MEDTNTTVYPRIPWNKGKLVGQKVPFKPKEIRAIRIHLQMAHRAPPDVRPIRADAASVRTVQLCQ